MDISKYPPSNQLTQATEIIRLLFANGAKGLSPSEIAHATKLAPGYVTQQLGQLANLRLVEEIGESGKWRPGVVWAQWAVALNLSIHRELGSMQEYQQRITRSPT